MLGPRCCTWTFPVGEQGLLPSCGATAPHCFSCCRADSRTWASAVVPLGTWGLLGAGLEHRFLPTRPPGKSSVFILCSLGSEKIKHGLRAKTHDSKAIPFP